MIGYLRAKNISVSERQVREPMRRVDLEGILLRSRQLTIISRRHYSVPGTNALRHINGNHKFIRYSKTLITFSTKWGILFEIIKVFSTGLNFPIGWREKLT